MGNAQPANNKLAAIPANTCPQLPKIQSLIS